MVNGLILVDNALNESMLNSSVLKGHDETNRETDMKYNENDEKEESKAIFSFSPMTHENREKINLFLGGGG